MGIKRCETLAKDSRQGGKDQRQKFHYVSRGLKKVLVNHQRLKFCIFLDEEKEISHLESQNDICRTANLCRYKTKNSADNQWNVLKY